jgi:hypothetical protein
MLLVECAAILAAVNDAEKVWLPAINQVLSKVWMSLSLQECPLVFLPFDLLILL